jgi:hypothetical protein
VGGGAAFTTSVSVADALAPNVSVAVTTTDEVEDEAGVPLIDPVVGSITSGDGSPVAVQVTAPTPPLAPTVAEYAVPAVTAGNAVVEMATAALTTIVSGKVADPTELTACTVKAVDPAAVGVPESVPVAASNASHDGRPDTVAAGAGSPPMATVSE